MAKSKNDLVAAAQTLARLKKRRRGIEDRFQKQLAEIDQDIATVSEMLRVELTTDVNQ